MNSTAHVRPNTTAEMLDRVFYVLAAYPGLFLSLSLLSASTDLLLAGLIFWTGPNAGGQTGVLLALTLWLAGNWAAAAGILSAFQLLLFPLRVLTFKAAMRAALPRLPYFVLTNILLSMIIVSLAYILPLWLFSPKAHVIKPPFNGALALLCAAAAAWFLMRWALYPVIVIMENIGLLRAAGRSAELMSGRFTTRRWKDSPTRRLLIILLPPLCIVVLVMGAFQGAALLATGLWAGPKAEAILGQVIYHLGSGAVSLFALPFLWIGLAILYAECRMRLEALDFQIHLSETSKSGEPISDLIEPTRKPA